MRIRDWSSDVCSSDRSLCLSQPAARRVPARTRYLSEREDSKAGGSNAMWGGRFAAGPSAIMREINASIPFDKALWRQDIAASKAHVRSEEHTSELQSLMRISYAVFCLKKKKNKKRNTSNEQYIITATTKELNNSHDTEI